MFSTEFTNTTGTYKYSETRFLMPTLVDSALGSCIGFFEVFIRTAASCVCLLALLSIEISNDGHVCTAQCAVVLSRCSYGIKGKRAIPDVEAG